MNQKEIETLIRKTIVDDEAAALKALSVVYGLQTTSEQRRDATLETNGQGFRISDAKTLSRIKRHYDKFHKITPSMLLVLKKRMPRYSKQLFQHALANGVYIQLSEKEFVSTKNLLAIQARAMVLKERIRIIRAKM